MMKDMSKKWRNFRLRLYHGSIDTSKSREENIRFPPKGVPAVHWANFIDYRWDDKVKEMCQKNAENRAKLTINHTGGSKKLKTRKAEMMSQTGQPVSRGDLYIETHKKANGAYINEEARVICEKIAEIESQGNAPKEISPNDSLGQVFGKEHPGRVRGMGDGVCPSQVFGSRYERSFGASSSEQNRVAKLENQVEELKTELKTKDEKMKKIEVLLAQLLKNASMPVPSDLASGLDVNQTDDSPVSARSNTDQP